MKRILLILSAVLLLAGCVSEGEKGNSYRRINTAEAATEASRPPKSLLRSATQTSWNSAA